MLRWLAALLLLALAQVATAQTFPPLTGRVVDAAKLLTPDQVRQLDQLSAGVEEASSRQFVVATVPDLQGYPIEDYGYRLGRAWKIGQEGANNGVILLVAPTEKKVRIEVGYGLEPIVTDALSSVIINGTILPRFRDGDMGGGVVAGAQAIAEQLKLPPEAAERRAQAQVQAATPRHGDRGIDQGDVTAAIFWIVVILFVVVPLVARRTRGRRYRGGSAPVILWGPGLGGWGGGGSEGGSSWGGGGGGGFSGGGGSFGGGGASGGW